MVRNEHLTWGDSGAMRSFPWSCRRHRLLFEMLFQAVVLGTHDWEGKEAGQRQGGWEEEAVAGG